ncbi:PD-(D/E)XK nuclease family protein [Candidatus Pacearchaeota archaeon]|nr:PD-(D/E)XK nuclease family protein [Candidatus Pacearchaeota archaeon]
MKTIYSHSRLSSFEQCPLKFKFRYIDKIVPDIKQTIEGFLGNQVHDVLEWIYIERKKEITVELDDVIRLFSQNWHKKYADDIKVVKDDMTAEDYYNLGIKFLIDYYFKNQPFKDNTIATELRILIDLDENKKYQMQGYIDRLVHNKDNNVFEIHDYKTSNSMKSQKDLDKDRQLALYSLGIRDKYPNATDVHLIWHYLAFNKKMKSSRTIGELDTLKQELIKLIDEIESATEFPPKTSCLCRWCEFQSNCPEMKKEIIHKDTIDANDCKLD